MFILHCTNAAGESVRLRYDPHASALTNQDGSPVLAGKAEPGRPPPFEDAVRVSPSQPGTKRTDPVVLKIQLGLGCNYSCSYCNQASQVDSMALTRTADAQSFLNDLDNWLEGAPDQIEFWGGEPLLYFRKLQVLVPELDRRSPDAEFSMVTNGSLLTQEIVDFIAAYDIRITLSHDGPGQHVRGADPFDDPQRFGFIRALWTERKPRQRMIFSSVLTPENCDPTAMRQWFARKLDDEDVVTSFEGVVATHDDRALAGPGIWSSEQYERLRTSVAKSFETGEALRMPALLERARNFLKFIEQGTPSSSMGQKCGMDRSDHLAVDLHSNVLTCQNTGATSKHGLGSALRMEEVQLDTSTHWAYREHCSHCPVLQLCGGSCMYLDGDQFAQSCENEFQFGLGILDGVMRRAFGLKLERIEGDVRRPVMRKTIAIAAVH
ncbi:radical SAM protein [Variovorax sp. Varisp41]|uniref:radical SAM protein n=1 Tax=Variovorax sp. Varisp41 TaxID=3243033 RepID=UPI0039B38E06